MHLYSNTCMIFHSLYFILRSRCYGSRGGSPTAFADTISKQIWAGRNVNVDFFAFYCRPTGTTVQYYNSCVVLYAEPVNQSTHGIRNTRSTESGNYLFLYIQILFCKFLWRLIYTLDPKYVHLELDKTF